VILTRDVIRAVEFGVAMVGVVVPLGYMGTQPTEYSFRLFFVVVLLLPGEGAV
jgi:hypothetical protein